MTSRTYALESTGQLHSPYVEEKYVNVLRKSGYSISSHKQINSWGAEREWYTIDINSLEHLENLRKIVGHNLVITTLEDYYCLGFDMDVLEIYDCSRE